MSNKLSEGAHKDMDALYAKFVLWFKEEYPDDQDTDLEDEFLDMMRFAISERQ